MQPVWEFLETPVARAIIMVAALAILVMFGYYIVLKFRDFAGRDERVSASAMLDDFRELHEEGNLDAKEYKNIKGVLGERLQQELQQNESKNNGHAK